MIKEERKKYLLAANKKLITYLNTIIGFGKDKIMSQRELANYLGCSNSTIARWLNGESPLSIDMAIKICDILNINKNDFFDNLIFVEKESLESRFLKLSNENKMKVLEYINFLSYQEQINNGNNKTK